MEQAVYFVSKKDKVKLLVHLLKTDATGSVLIFSRTKHGANKIVRLLSKAHIEAEAIHSNKSQAARQKALGNFKNGRTKVLVATDIAARGIDVDDLSHVINYDLPNILKLTCTVLVAQAAQEQVALLYHFAIRKKNHT